MTRLAIVGSEAAKARAAFVALGDDAPLVARYTYVRVTIALGTVEVCAGVELNDDERCDVLYVTVRREASQALGALAAAGADDATLAAAFARLVALCWPGRNYFCEVGRTADDSAYVQVFEPKRLVDPA